MEPRFLGQDVVIECEKGGFGVFVGDYTDEMVY